jgi:hypothetical protein
MTAWLGDSPDGMRRVRADGTVPRQIPRSSRYAEIVCRAPGRSPFLLASIYPVGVPVESMHIIVNGPDVRIGDSFTAFCRCPAGSHHINGGALRSALLNLAKPHRGRPTPIEVGSVADA